MALCVPSNAAEMFLVFLSRHEQSCSAGDSRVITQADGMRFLWLVVCFLKVNTSRCPPALLTHCADVFKVF